MKKPKILYYDLETSPLKAYVWQLGKQVVRHGQLDQNHAQYGIICVTYCWNDGKPAKCIDWGYEEQDTKKLIEEFDKIIKQADFVIGKNSARFDNKMLNACRMFAGLPGYPQWTRYTEDLEKQMRRYFRLPSYALDYVSEQFGLGGKIKMEFSDWINIVEKNEHGLSSFKKMIKYGKKDVEDTRKLWQYMEEHFETKINVARFNDNFKGCRHCGGLNVHKDGFKYNAGVKYQQYQCNDCGKYAGRATISPVVEKEGKLL